MKDVRRQRLSPAVEADIHEKNLLNCHSLSLVQHVLSDYLLTPLDVNIILTNSAK